MGLKKLKTTFKKKLVNQIVKRGKKQMVEKEITKSLKKSQKSEKKNTSFIVKQSSLSVMPVFRVIKLTNNRRRKKTIKKIPAFLSNNNFRSSWASKNLVALSLQQETLQKNLQGKLVDGFLHSANQGSNLEKVENNLAQEEASKEKKYFKFYRW